MNGHAVTMDIKMEWSDEDEARRREKKGVIHQILISLCANCVVLGPAMGFGYSAVALGSLMSPSSDVKIDYNQANWIATAAALGTPLGCLLTSIVMSRGRKLSLLVVSVISFIGWITIYMSNNYEQIMIGRVISGIASGMASVPATVYSAEIAGVKWRGTMITWTSVSIAMGVLIVYIFGLLFKEDWRLVALMCALFPLASVVIVLMVLPESPVWLRERGRLDEALEIFKKFRGIPTDQAATVDVLLELKPRVQQTGKKTKNILKHLLKRNALIPFAIMLTYFLFQQFSGIFVMVYYAVDIVQSVGITIDPYLGAVFIGFTRLLGSLLVAAVSRKYGRRIPSIVSGAGMTLCMGFLSIYLIMTDRGHTMHDRGIFPVVCILMYIFLSTLGFLSIPFAMIGEIYPTKVKDLLAGLTVCLGYFFSSVTIKTYPDMLLLMGKHGVFFFYAVVSLCGTLFVLFLLPETKGKSLHEIEDMFVKRKPHDVEEKDNAITMISLKNGSNGVERPTSECTNE
ncbi:hypothetical protein KPH14_002730 [Odynerus spinipes]|uniref:Major facilitator superfamily (MFS) profile domain-containing protein n=1 Tax=Odynerus spinipes TaxID=1348599 RepID=A0AAD9RLN5_9HYME|nr:hypothetical protein KPH14_002730 [Odynerus spinipes]